MTTSAMKPTDSSGGRPSARPSASAQYVALIRGQLPRPCTPEADIDGGVRLYASLASDGTPFGRFMAARTRFFDHEVITALESGIDQVVILAAGYDDRALRFKSRGVTFYELDLAATQEDKTRRLRNADVDTRQVEFAVADFTADRVSEVLSRTSYDRGRPGIFLCEGALLYLPYDAIIRLLEDTRTCAAHGSIMAVSFAITKPAARSAPPMPNKSGEYRQSFFTPSSADALLQACGWRRASSEHPDQSGAEQDDVAIFAHAVPVPEQPSAKAQVRHATA